MDTGSIFTTLVLTAATAVVSVIQLNGWIVDVVMNLVEAEKNYYEQR